MYLNVVRKSTAYPFINEAMRKLFEKYIKYKYFKIEYSTLVMLFILHDCFKGITHLSEIFQICDDSLKFIRDILCLHVEILWFRNDMLDKSTFSVASLKMLLSVSRSSVHSVR